MFLLLLSTIYSNVIAAPRRSSISSQGSTRPSPRGDIAVDVLLHSLDNLNSVTAHADNPLILTTRWCDFKLSSLLHYCIVLTLHKWLVFTT